MTTRADLFVSREALWPVAVLFVLTAIAYSLGAVIAGHVFLVLLLLVVFMARNPRCPVPSAPLGVVAPVSGRVLVAGKGADPFLARDAVQVRIRMAPWHTHVARSPVEGEVQKRWLARGWHVWAQRRHAIHIRTDEGDDVVIVFNLNLLAPLVRILMRAGNRVGQGHRCGYIYLHAVLDVYLRADTSLACSAGDAVRAGSSLVATFGRPKPEAGAV